MGALAHQIRTPLAAALLYAGGVEPPEARAPLLERLRHLESLVEEMLRFARGEHLEVVPVALDDLVRAFAAREEEARVGGAEGGRALVRARIGAGVVKWRK